MEKHLQYGDCNVKSTMISIFKYSKTIQLFEKEISTSVNFSYVLLIVWNHFQVDRLKD